MKVCIVLTILALERVLIIHTAGKALPFDGVYVNYKKTGLSSGNFQKIAAGETITVAVNAAKSYRLNGVKQAKVSAIQSFHYAKGEEAPAALEGLSFCADQTTGSVEVTPDQSVAAEYATLSNPDDNNRLRLVP